MSTEMVTSALFVPEALLFIVNSAFPSASTLAALTLESESETSVILPGPEIVTFSWSPELF